MLAQQMHQQSSVFNVGGNSLAVDRQFDCGHEQPPDTF
jgi:hypothetical protein